MGFCFCRLCNGGKPWKFPLVYLAVATLVHKPVIICDKNKQRMTAISVADFMLNLLRTKCLFRSVEFNVSILFLALILSLFQNGSDAEKPPCSLSPNNLNNSFANLLKSVTFVTSNKTAYVNETVVFRIDINLNENDTTVIPVAYVDRNYEKSSCVLHEEGTVQSRICTFYNVQLSDNGKEIHFYLLAPVLDVQICYEPPSFLHVKGMCMALEYLCTQDSFCVCVCVCVCLSVCMCANIIK